jgi:glycosyltransferase involved in cell wall biosynthesis
MSRDLAVLMTAFNAEKTIGKAIESLKRDREPFDLLIVDDCSRVPLAEVIGAGMPGIEIMRAPHNLGVAGAKNLGLKHLLERPYEFVAMMDADDICISGRLAKQVSFLRQNPEIALVGTWARYIDETTREVVFHFTPPCAAEDIREALFINNCIVHPTWMARTQVLRDSGLYSDDFPAAEDYEMLRRMAETYELANLPEFLLDYTVSMSGVSMTKRRQQLVDRMRIQAKYFDPGRLNAWLGMVRTALLFAVPQTLVNAYRVEQRGRVSHQEAFRLGAGE